MNIQGLIFDKDGTLFEFQSSWGDWFYNLLVILSDKNQNIIDAIARAQKFNIETRSFDSGSQFIAGTLDETISLISPFLETKSDSDIKKIVIENLETLNQRPATNLKKLFRLLKSNKYALGVVTNDQEKSTKIQLQNANIFSFFDFIAGCDSGFGYKPNPQPLLAFSDHVNLPRSSIAIIGDSTHDLKAGIKANMWTVGVLSGVAGHDDLRPYADAILNSIADLPEWLKQINN